MNEENKKQVILMIVFVVAAIGVVGYQMGPVLFPPSTDNTNTASATATDRSREMNIVDVNIDDLLQGIAAVDFDYAAEHISRDPMRPLIGGTTTMDAQADGQSPSGPGSYIEVMQKRVTGVLWDENNPVAIVDNEIVTIGYTYTNGIVVQDIGRDGVTFKVGDSLIPVTMEEL